MRAAVAGTVSEGNLTTYTTPYSSEFTQSVRNSAQIVASYGGMTSSMKTVKEAGIEFAFIRAGYRGTTEGNIHDDEYFDANMRGAAENGIPAGVYFFSQAVTEEEALEEAEYTLKRIKDYDVTYPVVFDMEEPEYEEAVSRAASLSIEEKTRIANVFLYRIQKKAMRR